MEHGRPSAEHKTILVVARIRKDGFNASGDFFYNKQHGA